MSKRSTMFDSVTTAAAHAEAGEIHTWIVAEYTDYGWGEEVEYTQRRVDPSEGFLHKPRDFGFGGADGPPVYAWTSTHIIVPVEYDGATRHVAVPLSSYALLVAHDERDETGEPLRRRDQLPGYLG